MNSRQR